MSSWALGSGSFVSLAKGGNGQARTAWQLSGRPSESGSVCPAADLAPGSVSAVRCGLPHLSVSPCAGRGRGEVLRVRGKRGPSCRGAQGAGKTPRPAPDLFQLWISIARGQKAWVCRQLFRRLGRRAPDFTAPWDATPGPVSGSWPSLKDQARQPYLSMFG